MKQNNYNNKKTKKTKENKTKVTTTTIPDFKRSQDRSLRQMGNLCQILRPSWHFQGRFQFPHQWDSRCRHTKRFLGHSAGACVRTTMSR